MRRDRKGQEKVVVKNEGVSKPAMKALRKITKPKGATKQQRKELEALLRKRVVEVREQQQSGFEPKNGIDNDDSSVPSEVEELRHEDGDGNPSLDEDEDDEGVVDSENEGDRGGENHNNDVDEVDNEEGDEEDEEEGDSGNDDEGGEGDDAGDLRSPLHKDAGRKRKEYGSAANDGAPKKRKNEGGTAAEALAKQSEGTAAQEATSGSMFFTDEPFHKLPLSDSTKSALTTLGFVKMTRIQSLAIPPLLAGKDVVGAAKTGSGKTLAFLVPVLELLSRVKWAIRNGTGAVIISPTRELSLQIYGVLRDLCEEGGYPLTHGLVMGGANRRSEADRLIKGVSILVATPGRLLDHLQNTKGFLFRNLQMLVIDEADRILEQGFEEDMHQIIKVLPKQRQTMLFSATQTKKVEDLTRLSIQGKPVFVGAHDDSCVATVGGLEQGYVVCPSDKRFLLLLTFLKRNKGKKIMVFFSSCNSVKFHSELLNYIDVSVMDIHGRQKQQKRTTTFFQFCRQETGTLLCTDVAARGLDIPAVDWIIQFDPPDDPKEYIHRVGRTARGAAGRGRALLLLTPEEVGFLRYLKAAKVALNEYEFPEKKVANVHSQLTKLIEKNYYLNKSARDAYRSYLLAYASHSHKDIFNVHELDLQAVARGFGFSVPPRVDLSFSARGQKGRVKTASKAKSRFGGHKFSASNPYGKRAAGDQRQFVK